MGSIEEQDKQSRKTININKNRIDDGEYIDDEIICIYSSMHEYTSRREPL